MPEVEGVLGQLDAERGVDEPAHQRNGDGLDLSAVPLYARKHLQGNITRNTGPN